LVAESVSRHLRHEYTPDPLGDGSDLRARILIQLSTDHKVITPFEAMVDSGSSICLFHGSIARALGISLKTGEPLTGGGIVQGLTLTMYAHEVKLHFENDVSPITAYFSDEIPNAAILGMEGFFDRYVVKFDPVGFEISHYNKS
jgi:hypothetical protein